MKSTSPGFASHSIAVKSQIDPNTLSAKSRQIQMMFDRISNTYDFLNRLLSFGQDVRWREQALRLMPDIQNLDGIHYDVACGTGDMLIGSYHKRKDYNHFIGFDLSLGMINVAKKRCQNLDFDKLSNQKEFEFIQSSADHMPVSNESAHCLTITFGLRNIENREAALKEFFRVLKPNGILIILDFFEAENTLFSKLFQFYFRSVLPKIGGLFSDKNAYEYLPKSVSAMPKSAKMVRMLIDSGFCSYVEQHTWLSGAVRLFVAKKMV